MSYNGSGTFLINSAGQPVVANTVISATVFNALTSDLATGLSTAITKDGQTTITANIPFGSNKITGLGAGTAATDAANLSQVQSTAAKLVTVTGTDTITGSMSPQLTAYAAGQLFYFVANAANTGAVTINIDSLGAKAITRDGSTALAAGDINSGEVVVVIYDGTRFQMINAANSFGNTTINGTLTVTGNTGLQANVSITSTLSVGGTFAVTGAATLGSTLAVTGKSDLPTVSTASINAAVALITTGTVTNLTASGASIASANIGNLQFTAASIASINAGVAVITNLTATGASIASANVETAVITAATVTGASIASANVGTAVITTGTVTNLTSTSASVASINAAVALITTGTVTALTATGASVASANVGTAVVTGLTVTNASIASLNAGTATITTGNLTFSSTAQRITGDMSNATITNRLMVQTSTTNGNTLFSVMPNGTGTAALVRAFNSSTPAQFVDIRIDATEAQLRSSYEGTSTFLPLTFYTGGSERMRLDTSGNLGIGTASPGSRVTLGVNASDTALSGTSNTAGLHMYVRAFGVAQIDSIQSGANNSGMSLRTYNNGTYTAFIENTQGNTTTFATAGSERMRIDSSGNVGIGGTANAFSKFEIMGTLPSSSGATVASRISGTFPSSTTSNAYAFATIIKTATASYTLTNMYHFSAYQDTLGAGSTVTNQFGFFVDSTLTGATNNYGFYSNIASASNRWNFYAAGTAQNYFAGNTGIGITPNANFVFHVKAATNVTLGIQSGTTVGGALTLNAVNDANSANVPLDFRSSATYFSAGIGTTASAANAYIDNAANNQLLRSTSSLRYKRDVATYARGLSELMTLRAVSFKGISESDGDKTFAGLIAEEVHDAGLTEFVAYDKEGRPDALHYGNMVALLVKAVQELKAELEALKAA